MDLTKHTPWHVSVEIKRFILKRDGSLGFCPFIINIV